MSQTKLVATTGRTTGSASSRRLRAELPVASPVDLGVRVGALAVVLGASVAYLNTNRGVGLTFALFVGLVAVVDLLLRRTRWGRAVRAVGGNVESARRAGIPIRRTLVSVFVACSTLAALGGVLSVGRLAAANQATGGGDTNLTAIAAAVIAEASLSFLGLGQQPPQPSWGSMLNTAKNYIDNAPWMAIWPGLSIFLLVLSFNLVGDGLRDALDPRFS